MTIDQIREQLDALATDDLQLLGDWSAETANQRCHQYATLIVQLLGVDQ